MNDVQYISLGPRAKDLTGERFHRLIVLGPIGKTNDGHILWLCQCDCGNTSRVGSNGLRPNGVKSCGCQSIEAVKLAKTTHGLKGHPLYYAWSSIVQRCTNPSSKKYPDWGGRGITVCDEWRHDFQAFYDHVSELPHCGEEGYSLDRVDNNLGYSPGNVRWATWTEQHRNRRDNHLITFDGKTQCLQAWADETGISQTTLSYRFNEGWSAERALTTPARRYRQV